MTETLASMVSDGTDTMGTGDAGGAVARLASLPGLTTASGVAAEAAGASAVGKLLPVVPELAAVLPLRGLHRGSTVSVVGSRAVQLALLAEATAQGSWAAVVGMPDIGVAAAAELGVELRRLVLVPRPGADVVRVTAALFDGVDLVVVAGRLSGRAARQLSARARHRGAVLVAAGPWPGADVELRCEQGRWHGVDGTGYGRLSGCELTVHCRSRRSARPVRTTVLLPGRSGRPEPLLAAPSGVADVANDALPTPDALKASFATAQRDAVQLGVAG